MSIPHLVQSSHPSPYSLGTHIKFIAESESDAVLWVSALREAIEQEEENAKRQVSW